MKTTLKERNDILEKVIDDSLSELSHLYSKETGEDFKFEYWTITNAKDLDKNICIQGVLDVRRITNGKVDSAKRLFDRMLIQRENTNFEIVDQTDEEGNTTQIKVYNTEKPTYGKQRNMEESRNAILRELLAKCVSGFALGMAIRTKDQIVEFNSLKETHPLTPDEAFQVEPTREDVETFQEEIKSGRIKLEE